jgi:hypothetical protein
MHSCSLAWRGQQLPNNPLIRLQKRCTLLRAARAMPITEMTSLKLTSLLILLLLSAFAKAQSNAEVHLQVDNEKIFLDGTELSSMDVLRTLVANASKGTVISIEAHTCTKWTRIEEVLEIVRERAWPAFTVRFSTFGESGDPVCVRRDR